MRTAELEAAYLATDYWVEDAPNGPFAIRVGALNVDLEEVLLEEVAVEWAYVTACNPESVPLSDEENKARTDELRETLVEAGLRFYEGVAVDPDGNWREPSFLVLELSEGDALRLAKRFGQNAIVVGHIAEPARLVWTNLPRP
jgi:hypothetical protein